MNKKYVNTLIIILLFLFLYEIFNHSNIVSNSIIDSSKIWFYNLIPSILPMYILIDLLINYKLLNYLEFILNPISKLFKININSSIIFVLSILSGFPSNSKYINTMLDNKNINMNDANKLLLFTHFSNPLFIINSIGINFLHNKNVAIVILICHYVTNFIIGILSRNYNVNLNKKNSYNNIKKNFITTLTNSIYNTIKILFLLYGIITMFMILISIINVNITINPILKCILTSILEITSGIYYISLLNINLIYKACLITFFLSFGGLSIHMQVFGILSKYKVKYSSYLKARLLHGLISSCFVYIILKILSEF
ncbi:MAG: hypothetical protein IKN63_03430 [Bacilli bacterium]|nr:hypothetical protein [Bacilli bacterium]